LRAEFLTGQVFTSIRAAQGALDEWVAYYNHDRPHQALEMATPAQRFQASPDKDVTAATVVDDSALLPDRTGDEWISRRVGSNGVVCVSWQQVSVGKHRAGQRCDVHVRDGLLQFWIGSDLVKAVARSSSGEVRKKNASRT
jgi:Integrase core domain